jgi:Subtilase family
MNLKILLRGLVALLFVVACIGGVTNGSRRQAHAQTASPEATPNDPGYQDDVARVMNLPGAWGKALSMDSSLPPVTTNRPAILVLDSALDCSNKDIKDVCVPALNRDFTTDNNYNDGQYDHGTAVASKIVGGWNNAFQATPIMPTNRLLLIGGKVFSAATGSGDSDWVRAGFDYAIALKAQGINVIGVNFSGGARNNAADDDPVGTEKRFQALYESHIVVGLAVTPVSQPGNLDGGNAAFLSLIPKYPNVFAADPLLSDEVTLATTYSWGQKTVGFAAPGQNIKQAAAGVDVATATASGSGSSVAVPEVLGTVAFVSIYRPLIHPTDPDYHPLDPILALYVVKATAKQTSSTSGKIGWGVPDALAALTADFTAPSSGLSLFTDANSPLGIALDHASRQGMPIPIVNPNNFSTDGRGRAMFFSPNTDVLRMNAVMELKDLAGNPITVPIEHLAAVPSHPQLAQITIRIPDGVSAGDYWATLVSGTMRSNSVIVSFQ